MTDPDRRELGSVFELSTELGEARFPWHDQATYWGSGRDALRGLLAWGRAEHGWRRLLCPSYMCQHVAAALAMEIELQAYPCGPLTTERPRVHSRAGDVVLAVASLGMRLEPEVIGPAPVIEDHTHDPLSEWAATSRSDYAAASLRKTLPLPDGGVVWSPRGLPIPPERPMTPRHARVAFQHLEGMALKRTYLDGGSIEKDAFRQLFLATEPKVGNGRLTGISPYSRARLASFPTIAWRRRRADNLAAFREALGTVEGVRILDSTFVATCVFDERAVRDRVRSALVAERIYPVVYWPLEERVVPGIREADIDLSRRILSIHVDQRYRADDMALAAGHVRTGMAAA